MKRNKEREEEIETTRIDGKGGEGGGMQNIFSYIAENFYFSVC